MCSIFIMFESQVAMFDISVVMNIIIVKAVMTIVLVTEMIMLI